MAKVKLIINYFSKFEIILWASSVLLIVVSFCIFDGENYLMLVASVIGATSLIFIAKGNPIGPFLMIAFSILYGMISFNFSYFGEMITYGAMTAPMALFSLISWLKNPHNGNKAEVKVSRLKSKDIVLMIVLSVLVTAIFYFILRFFSTANLLLSTASVATSFIAAYLTFKRSVFCAFAYAVNDVVVIALWVLAVLTDFAYLSIIICFAVFLVNDLYGFHNWQKISLRQRSVKYSQ